LPAGLALFVALAGRVPRGIARLGRVPLEAYDRANRAGDDAAADDLAAARTACGRAGLLGALPRALWRAVTRPDGPTTSPAPAPPRPRGPHSPPAAGGGGARPPGGPAFGPPRHARARRGSAPARSRRSAPAARSAAPPPRPRPSRGRIADPR